MAVRIETQFKIRGYIETLIGGRSENQDSAGSHETDIGTVIVVCDGMGGLNGGSVASHLAVETIINDVDAASYDKNPRDVLEEAIRHANRVILKKGENDPSLAGMGTTVTAVIVSKRCVTAAFVGDSRIYQLRGGKKVFRTMDHSQVFEYVKAGAITEEEARLSSNSNIILKALGTSSEVEPELYELPYIAGDRFVLCTDGFWGAQPEDKFISEITEKGNLADVIKCVAADINLIGVGSGGHHDNLTAAVFDVERDSILKEKMRKSIKVTIAILSILLLISVVLNLAFVKRLKDVGTFSVEEQIEIGTNSDETDEMPSVKELNVDSLSEHHGRA